MPQGAAFPVMFYGFLELPGMILGVGLGPWQSERLEGQESLILTPGGHLFHTSGLGWVSLTKEPHRRRVKLPAEQRN